MAAKDRKDVPAHICDNKNAFRYYELIEKVEAGIVLQGTEVKSIRSGGINLNDAYAVIENGEVYVIKMHIQPYSHGNRENHDPLRKRKLLLHKHQIRKLIGSVVEKGLTLVPTRMYWAKGRAKIEMALAKGKNKGDRRETVKKRDAQREMDKASKRSRK